MFKISKPAAHRIAVSNIVSPLRNAMHDLRTLDITKIKDGIKFEYLFRDIWKKNKKYELVAFNGRPGQAQNGVDIFGRKIEDQQWFGIQCKARKNDNKLGETEIREEINKAKYFTPSLKNYTLITTLNRDEKLQELMRLINSESDVNFVFDIFILG
jgi:hypothetical protein